MTDAITAEINAVRRPRYMLTELQMLDLANSPPYQCENFNKRHQMFVVRQIEQAFSMDHQ